MLRKGKTPVFFPCISRKKFFFSPLVCRKYFIMNQLIFWCSLLILLFLFIYLDLKYHLLRDDSTANIKPFSYSRIQLAWWTWIILSCFVSIILCSGKIPELDTNLLILLGISAGTTMAGRLIDLSDDANAYSRSVDISKAAASGLPQPSVISLSRNTDGTNLILDILSDEKGVSIHRLQAVSFNLIFGCWFLYKVFMEVHKIAPTMPQEEINGIMNIMTNNYLILIGVSAGTYAALKTTENR